MQNDPSQLPFLGNPGAFVSMPGFALNLLLAAVLAFLLGQAYMRFGQALSNRKIFARNFLILTLTTTLIISIIKSYVALSLGLVGALSIVRFRAAIKEPEELAYLFLAISIGLGLGAAAGHHLPAGPPAGADHRIIHRLAAGRWRRPRQTAGEICRPDIMP